MLAQESKVLHSRTWGQQPILKSSSIVPIGLSHRYSKDSHYMKTIIWDMDDALNYLLESCSKNVRLKEHLESGITYESLKENPPHNILQIGLDEYLASLDQFRLSKVFTSIEPNSDILQWFKVHVHKCRHIALTAIPLETAYISSSWVLIYFGRWIRTFAFVPSERPKQTFPVYEKNKIRLCKMDRPVQCHHR